jgi:hypothetical protein
MLATSESCDRCGAQLPMEDGPELEDGRYGLCPSCLGELGERELVPSVWTARRRSPSRADQNRRPPMPRPARRASPFAVATIRPHSPEEWLQSSEPRLSTPEHSPVSEL